MPRTLRFLLLPLLVAIGLLALGGESPLHAQLDLPGGKRVAGGSSEGSPGSRRLDLPSRTKGDLAPGSEGRGGLDLPGGARPASPAASGKPGVPPAASPAPPVEYEASPHGAVAFIFDELAAERELTAPLVDSAVQSLASLGEPALVAARERLGDDHPPTLAACARFLLAHGLPDDRRAVAERLSDRLPSALAHSLLAELANRDPQIASPRYLAGLLDHKSGSMRSAAQRLLEERVGSEHLSLLASVLGARRADTRLRGLELLAGIEDPAVLPMLLSRIGDDSAKVAFRAANLLADVRDERTADALRARAFGEERIDRGGAYALLAAIQIEEGSGELILLDEHVLELREGMRSSQEIVVGACAAALAGIGFRSERSRQMEWLDLQVPHQLVRLTTGAVFHQDFSSLQGIARRRLTLITGQAFGSDNAAWRQWWTEHARTFRARRAVIDVQSGDELSLEISYHAGPRASGSCRLLGPAAGEGDEVFGGLRLSPVFYLSEAECIELVALLRREGVFGVERAPDRPGGRVEGRRSFAVTIADQGKMFLPVEGREAPWFERLANATLALAERNRWQLFRDVNRHLDQRSQWRAEHTSWTALSDPSARNRRFVAHLVAVLGASHPLERDAGVEELVRLYAIGGTAHVADFPAFVGFLGAEGFFGRRAGFLLDLALAASAADAAPDGQLERGRTLVSTLAESLGEAATPAITRVLEASGEELCRWAATDPRPRVRAGSATALVAREPVGPAAQEALLSLLGDDDPEVEAAALLALGLRRVERAREAILVRARIAAPPVRAAALIAASRLGGEEVRKVLEEALFDEDGRVQGAAAEGLAELADPTTAGLLVQLFAQGRESVFFEPASRGLRRIGVGAWDDLLRLANTGGESVRREASLLLSEQGVPEAAPNLMTILTRNPGDARVAAELTVLSCVDCRGQDDPSAAWWGWWDLVVHDDSRRWLCAAAEREQIAAPPPYELAGKGTAAGATFLVEVMRRGSDPLFERARRELARILAVDLGAAPPRGRLREEWLVELDAAVKQHFVEEGR